MRRGYPGTMVGGVLCAEATRVPWEGVYYAQGGYPGTMGGSTLCAERLPDTMVGGILGYMPSWYHVGGILGYIHPTYTPWVHPVHTRCP